MDKKSFEQLYENFNSRKIDLVTSGMTDDVKWANGMEGGHVYGRNGVREYWTKQFTLISPKVTPLEIEEQDGIVKIKVHQVADDLNGNLLADELVYHYFQLRGDKIAQFDIGEKIKNNP